MKVPNYIEEGTRQRILSGEISRNVAGRILVEGKIMNHCAKELTKAGYAIRVLPGFEDDDLPWMTIARRVMLESMACDQDIWLIAKQSDDGPGEDVGSIAWVQGNEGWDVMNDWSWNETDSGRAFSDLMGKISDYATQF